MWDYESKNNIVSFFNLLIKIDKRINPHLYTNDKNMTNEEKRKYGEQYVKDHLVRKGYSILARKENGSDIIAEKKGTIISIEVKTTSDPKGIPDMHTTEFRMQGGKWYFVADYLYIVRLVDDSCCQLDVLSREEIDRYADSHKQLIRIRTTKLDTALSQGLVGNKSSAEIAWRKDRNLPV